ncbi:DUF4846 domain-containing protein [Niabella ginsengisoli]|uniref:DUF4846 domain-containing protein n=1 Tax=Niabella ginsengisoli TaxID=522298 RepID=A0ABS9SIJ6_9BACT|nr:DUF4846 domain-containing protein [Niabella ginsengisoli]MCH5598166.1 DUF4846 domain-containing protein [Niabella ginsengisoli]
MKLIHLSVGVLLANNFTCSNTTLSQNTEIIEEVSKAENYVSDIKIPHGFRVESKSQFATFLGNLNLKSDKTVYLYDGSLKPNQDAQYAVLDISVGDKNLQQCADAVIRLRAEYLFSQKRYNEIEFKTVSGTYLNFKEWLKGKRYRLKGNSLIAYQISPQQNTRDAFDNYLEFVFSYCGTASLGSSLVRKALDEINAGDVFLKPGSPGHAVIVMATAINNKKKKYFF